MVDIDQYVSDFIRDAQYRISEIAAELDSMPNYQDPRYKELEGFRLDLYLFMDILYVGYWSIIDGYNHLDWTDEQIMSEAEYLRNKTEMITSPFVSFVAEYPQIVNIIGASTGGLPSGDPLDIIQYNANGSPVTVPMPDFAGMQTGDTPTTYFS